MKPVYLLWLAIAALMFMPLTLVAETGLGSSTFNITRSSADGIQVHFELPQWKLESVQRNGETLQRVSIADAQYIFIDEEETLPVFTTLIAIPYSGSVTLNTLGSDQQNRASIKLDFDATLRNERNNNRYSAALYPADAALISAPQVLRDFRVVSVNIYPFQYDQQNKQLIVNESMDIRIDFNNSPSINEIAPPTSYSSAFAKIYQGLILNYNEMIDRDVTYTSPKLLVIYGNYSDTNYLAKVNEYVAWKRQRGFIVSAVSTATSGTTSTLIKTYIQNQYNNTTTRPDYVVFIGDISGSMPIPTYNTYIDYYYTWLAGGDNLGDVIIGRISVETTEQLVNYMAKIVSLEQNLDIGTASWLDRMVLVGDTAHSGISTIYTNQYIEDIASAVNPDYTYSEEFNAAPSNANVNTAINQGVAFYNYRGYYGMSGWPSYIASLNNQYKLFHAVIITCGTGDFNGTSTTESVVRQGTAASLGGSVTAIGMATTSTATPQNNCLNVGIFHSIYDLGSRDMGTALLYGKLYLNAIYGVSNPTQAYNFAAYCNLIGDPTASVYVSIPNTFNVTFPSSIPAGSRHIEVVARNAGNQVVEGASVTLTNSSGPQALGFTDAQGKVLLSLAGSLSGSLTLTVSKDDFKPSISSISIISSGGAVFSGVTIDDDATGASSGNANGVANSGETIELYVNLLNTTTSNLLLSASVTTTDTYVTLIEFDRIEYNSIAAGIIGHNDNPIVFSIDPTCPENHQITLNMLVESTAGTWTVMVPILVRNGKLNILSYTFVGATGNIIHPGDTFPMTISVQNSGQVDLAEITATLSSHDSFLSVTDTQGYYGSIAQGATVSNSSNTFTVNALSTCVEGMIIPLDLVLTNSAGYLETLPLTLTIGQVSVNDPLGQDAYGYFIFDQGDTAYDQCPTYAWIGVAPAEGGSGTLLNLTDPGVTDDEGDQVGAVSIQTVNLPFAFKYYGVEYTQASISANGFISFGQTVNSDWRNWRLPDAGGPSQMVAVFWDDLEIGTGSGVYTYYNTTLHYYVVEWYSMVSGFNSSTRETFQAILYDPVFFPTHTGDGQIKLQYNLFSNIDTGNTEDNLPHGNYCTIGIENQTASIGLEYTFNNTYPTAAAPLSNGSALFITTRPLNPDYPYITIENVTVNDTNSNAHMEPGESATLPIRLGNRGLVDATGVSAVLSTSDPYVTINNNYSVYGDILAQGNAYPVTNYAITVSGSCPGGHEILFTLTITGDDGNWAYNFPIAVYTPVLGFDNMIINDITGNNNRTLDPGETAEILILLNNSGEVSAVAGTASLTCGTAGITVNTGSDAFPTLAAGASETLSFSVTASSSMAIGTSVQFGFNAASGTYSFNHNETLIVGLIIETFENGNFSSFPWAMGTYPWTVDTTAPYAGVYSAKSGTIADNGSSTMQITRVITASGALTFHYKVSSENNYDYLKFYIDGVQQNQWSGEVAWSLATYTIAAGTRILKWEYMKDVNVISGSDCAWVDDITFPASTNPSNFNPPQNPAASASNLSVLLTWTAPVSGTPTGYKVYRNSSLLTTVTALTHTDLAVVNGTTYSYNIKAAYTGGDSDATSTVTGTPNAIAPSNLTAVGGNTIVNLSWTSASGREELGSFSTPDRTISTYRIYRNGTALTTSTGTTYQDTGLTNGVSYSYYVTTVYINPAGESAASNTASATPSMISYVVLGTGTSVLTGNFYNPINNNINSIHGQSVYTAAELTAAGIVGPLIITQMGFYIGSAPNQALPSFIIRMKHTTVTNAASWNSSTGMVTVYTNTAYMPVAGGYQMLTLTTPFQWNGTDNIVIDTAFGVLSTISQTGTLQYTDLSNGYRRIGAAANQTNVFVGGEIRNWRPNIRLALQPVSVGPLITVNPASHNYGNVVVNTTSSRQFTVQNTGDQTLTGTITTPLGFTVALVSRDSSLDGGLQSASNADRNLLSISITAGQTKTYSLVFAPTTIATYTGNMVISTNAANTPTVNAALTGSGYITSLAAPVVTVTHITGGFQLTWPAVTWAQSYAIYAATESYGTYSQIGTSTGLTYTDNHILPKAFYFVKAIRN